MLISKPFEDLITLVRSIKSASDTKEEAVCEGKKARISEVFSAPYTAEKILKRVELANNKAFATDTQVHICIFASSYDGINGQEALNFVNAAKAGAAPVNKLCIPNGLGLRVFELGLEEPHTFDPLWTDAGCVQSLAFGMEAVAAGGSILGLAACAPGGDAPAKKVLKSLCEYVSEDQIDSTITKEQLAVHALDSLRQFGGREIAAIMGSILAARSQNIALVIEGWAALSAVAVLEKIEPGFCRHVICGACPDEEYEAYCRLFALPLLLSAGGDLKPGCAAAIALSALMGLGSAVS